MNKIDSNSLSNIISFLYEFDYNKDEYVNYHLVCKTWNNTLNEIKCKSCLKGIYVKTPRNSKCNHCCHVLESKDITEERRKRLFSNRCC